MPVTKYYDEFVNFCRHLGERQYPEDLVQELFIYINKKEVSKSFCLTWLQWRVLDLHRHKKRVQKIGIDNISELASHDMPYEVDVFKDIHWFHKGVFNLWTDGRSLRRISKETKISVRTIQYSVNIIKQAWQEEEKRRK